MFEVSWGELLILAAVALICVGPKELPVFLGTLGRYAGMVRKQANEFRRYFDDAMREAELDQIRKDAEAMARDINDSVMSAGRDADTAVREAERAAAAVPAAHASAAEPVAIGAASAAVDHGVDTPAHKPIAAGTAPDHG